MLIDVHQQVTVKANDKIAIVAARFNQTVTDKLLAGALEQLRALGASDEQLVVVRVPGAVEIPFTAKQLAQRNKFKAIICLGAVIKGETDHYDYVCQQVSYGCQRLLLTQDIPIIFGILTTQTAAQAYSRVGGDKGHIGVECANIASEMIQLGLTISKL